MQHLKATCMKMKEVLKEELNKSLLKIKENTNSGIFKNVQGLKMEIKAIKRTQTSGILEIKNNRKSSRNHRGQLHQ